MALPRPQSTTAHVPQAWHWVHGSCQEKACKRLIFCKAWGRKLVQKSLLLGNHSRLPSLFPQGGKLSRAQQVVSCFSNDCGSAWHWATQRTSPPSVAATTPSPSRAGGPTFHVSFPGHSPSLRPSVPFRVLYICRVSILTIVQHSLASPV